MYFLWKELLGKLYLLHSKSMHSVYLGLLHLNKVFQGDQTQKCQLFEDEASPTVATYVFEVYGYFSHNKTIQYMVFHIYSSPHPTHKFLTTLECYLANDVGVF